MPIDIASAKESHSEAQGSGSLRDNDAGIPSDLRIDYEEVNAPRVKVHPESLITFDYISSISIPGGSEDFNDLEQNLQNAGEHGWGNNVILTVAGPEIVEGQLWTEDHDWRDYRVIGDPSSDESPYSVTYNADGEAEGIDLGMSSFDGAPVEGGLPAYVQFIISPRRAIDVLGALDTAGKWAFDQAGDFTEGIIETVPQDEDDDLAPRALGFPELRADMVEQPGAIAWFFDTDGDEEPTQQTRVDVGCYRVDGDDLEPLVPLTPEDENYALPTYPRSTYWDHDAEDVSGDNVDEATTDIGFGDTADGGQRNQQQSTTAAGTGGTPETFEELSEQDKEYVREAVTFLDGHDSDDLREVLDDFDDTYAGQIENGEATGDVPAGTMADIVAAQA